MAKRQHRCVAHWQLEDLGFSNEAVRHRREAGRWVDLHDGVYGIAPVFPEDRRTRWMAATLTTRHTYLAFASAAAAHGFRPFDDNFETVVRAGSGGPVWLGSVLVRRSTTLYGETTELAGIPITTPERTLIDLAPHLAFGALNRAVREALRLGLCTPPSLVDAVLRHRGRRGTLKLKAIVQSYSGLPVERCRSGSEVQALIVLRDAGIAMPKVNSKVAGEEADLYWPQHRLIIEIDGGPFHQDRGEDARKERLWRAAGNRVFRIPSGDIWTHPERLLVLAPR